jgi:hypothetical protein
MPADDRIDELLSQWQREQARGRDLPAAELCRACPELAPELERHVLALRQMNGLARAAEQTTSARSAESEPGATVAAAVTLPSLPGYEVLSKLGEGGMGVVFQARDLTLKRLVAIKQLLHPAPSGEGLARFHSEAEALARLDHPHVVKVHAAGERDGRPFFVMEYVEGGGLDRKIDGRPQPPADAARLVMLLARAVHSAHQQGIVHRDLKPANVLMAPPADEPALNTAYGLPKVSDFGLSKTLGEDQGRTAGGQLLGTPAYMAPEQASGRPEDVGPATDVYALGAILYQLLTGEVPFHGRSVLETLERVRTQPPRPPRELRPEVPAELEAVCLKCLAKAQADRYPTAQALAEDLGRALAAGVPAAGSAPSAAPQAARENSPPTAVARRPRPFRRLGLAVAGAGGLLLIAGVILAYVLMKHPADTGASQNLPPVSTSPSDPVRVRTLEVRQGDRTTKTWKWFGFLPPGAEQESYGASLGDDIQVKAHLSRPAYCYLIVFRGDGGSELLYPGNENEVPKRTDEPSFGRNDAYGLEEGPGLWLVAVVASEQPLPSYADWRRQHPGGPWARSKGEAEVVWRDDGNWLEELSPSGPPKRGPRGKKKLAGASPVVDVVDWLRAETGGVASAVGFTVEAKK